MGFFSKEEKKENTMPVYDFLAPPRNDLFPKLETLIHQAEVHYNAGDIELCKDVLDLIWRVIDRDKIFQLKEPSENPLQSILNASKD